MISDNIPYTLADYLDVIRRRWYYVAIILPLALLIAVYVAYTLSPMYRSSGTIMLERASVPEDMIRTTVESYAHQQIELLRGRVMTTDKLRELVAERDPYPNRTDLSPDAKARLIQQNTSIDRVDPVTLQPDRNSTAFSIYYDNPDPAMAQYVSQQLVDLFLDYNRQMRAERAQENYNFLLGRSDELRQNILRMEQDLADFKSRHAQALPEAQNRNQATLERAERDLDELERQLRLSEERRTQLDLQIGQVSPYLFDTSGDWRLEHAELRARLAEAEQRYTADHPDVRRLRRSLDALQERVEAMPADQRTPEPDNPEYIALATQLDATRQEVQALRTRAERARSRIADMEGRLVVAPEIERQYLQLMRDYDIAQGQFRTLQDNLSEAAMAQTLEVESRGERFTLVRNPSLPSSPISPNRPGIILLGFVLGGLIAVALVAVTESTDPSIRGTRDLRDITSVPAIGAVPVLINERDRVRHAALAAGAMLVLAVGLVLVSTAVISAGGGGP